MKKLLISGFLCCLAFNAFAYTLKGIDGQKHLIRPNYPFTASEFLNPGEKSLYFVCYFFRASNRVILEHKNFKYTWLIRDIYLDPKKPSYLHYKNLKNPVVYFPSDYDSVHGNITKSITFYIDPGQPNVKVACYLGSK